ISFDPAALEIWGALLNGACLVTMPAETALSPSLMADYVADNQITVLVLPTALFNEQVRDDPSGLSAIDLVIFGGEMANPRRVRRFLDSNHRGRLLNVYGPTEVTTITTWHPVEADQSPDSSVPIGGPISNTTVYLLDSRLRPVPNGVAGEIYAGGPGLARGYYGRPSLTAASFIPNGFSPEIGSRMYRTGDRGRRLSYGQIDFLGRIDEQVKIRGFRIEPGEIEAALRRHALVKDALVVPVQLPAGHKRLIAYVVARHDGAPAASGNGVNDISRSSPAPSELRRFLKEIVPEYMVPAGFVYLDSLPLNRHGKVDRKALPDPSLAEAATPAMRPAGFEGGGQVANLPHGELEQRLIALWSEALGRDQIGVDDNFFDLGGDSILSIQLAAKARRAGIPVTPALVFQHQTVAGLASALGDGQKIRSEIRSAEAAAGTGLAPLTPIQRWFFDLNLPEPGHFNLDLTLEVAECAGTEALIQALHCLMDRHDALNSRFQIADGVSQGGAGRMLRQAGDALPGRSRLVLQTILGRNDKTIASRVDLSRIADSAVETMFERLAGQAQRSLNLADGPLVRAVLFEGFHEKPRRLFITIHHLVVDWVSWRILLEDLDTLTRSLMAGDGPPRPVGQTSFKSWAESLSRYASSPTLRKEAGYWLALRSAKPEPPIADLREGANFVASETWLEVRLPEPLTRTLIREAAGRYETDVQCILLAALALAWREFSGSDSLLIDLEWHGRDQALAEADLAGTVGWFTSVFPVRLELPRLDDRPDDIFRVVRAIDEQLRRIPKHGIGYGVLRYLSTDQEIKSRLNSSPAPQISFNYLGQLDQAMPPGAMFNAISSRTGDYRDPEGSRTHMLDFQASVVERSLAMSLTYSHNQFHDTTIQRLAELWLGSLESLITDRTIRDAAVCSSDARPIGATLPSSGARRKSRKPGEHYVLSITDLPTEGRRSVAGYTRAAPTCPSQFEPDIASAVTNAQEVYGLTPMQEGMLLHSLDKSSSGAYWTQIVLTLEGQLDVEALATVWQRLVERHAVLRTGFAWKGLNKPVQVVHSAAEVDIQTMDWSGLASEIQETNLEQYLSLDREAGFDLETPPLMRLAIIKTAERTYKLAWSVHHILVDGWCLPILIEEMFALHEAAVTGTKLELPDPPSFRTFIEWLEAQDVQSAKAYWRQALEGVTPTLLAADRSGSASDYIRTDSVRLSREITERLAAVARTNRLTLNATIIGAWAIILGEWTGSDDVVFGTVVSGRPPDLSGADRMVGLLVNTLPLRVKLLPQLPALSMLREIQRAQVEMRNYEYSPLSQVRKWVGLSGDIALFDSIVGFENYPVDRNAGPDGSAVRITGIQAEEPTGYPIVLSAVPGDELFLKLAYRYDCFDRGAIANILDRMTGLLTQLAAAPELRLAALTLVNPGARGRVSRIALRPAVGGFSLCDRHGTVSAQAEAYATRDIAKASSERSTLGGDERPERERLLAAIWADVLGVRNVKPDDDFFELGGDSILSMQICSR
ncbi:MAG TPA: condensation domain-containing protein, partial [Blastocatellia bacterium]|nr:condensation domain-containing protein [Blastocatellia bacterium]